MPSCPSDEVFLTDSFQKWYLDREGNLGGRYAEQA